MQRPKLDENIRILEGLAASGLRSIRYALEVSASSRHCSKLTPADPKKCMFVLLGMSSVTP